MSSDVNSSENECPAQVLPEILDALPAAACAFRVRGDACTPLFMNQKCLEMLEAESYAAAYDHCGGDFAAFTHPNDVKVARRNLLRLLNGTEDATVSYECHIVTTSGQQRLVRVLASRLHAADSSTIVVQLFVGLNARRDVASETLDPVTGLISMHAFFQVMRERRGRDMSETKGAELALLYLDVVNFRSINVLRGMPAGDEFLRSLATNLRAMFPADDISRFETDHFAILTHADDMDARARDIREMVLRIAPKGVDVSIGACVWSDHALGPEAVCDRAKAACDASRVRANAFLSVYTEEMGRSLANAEYVVSHVDDAIKYGWIRVFYQPIIRSCSGCLCSMESLARWVDPKRGMLPPADFIGALEDSRQIHKLDLCVVEQVVGRIAERSRQGMTEIPLSVNLSKVDFLQCDIFQEVEARVKAAGIPRRLLRIEVTESTVTSHADTIMRALDRFRAAGYEVWMDDFGSGLSSLNLLKDYDFDVLKLDMGFLRDESGRSRDIVASVIAMGKRIGIHTLAEGVETKEQADFLRKSGCEMMQGYLFGKPQPFDCALRACLKQGILVESAQQRVLYGAASHVNFVTDTAIMLLDYAGGRFHVLQMNEAASRMIAQYGARDADEFERDVNEWNASSNNALDAAMQYSIRTGGAGEQAISFFGKEVLFRFHVLRQVDGHCLVVAHCHDVSSRMTEIANLAMGTASILQFYQSVFRIDVRRQTIQSLRFGNNISGSEDLGVIALRDGDGGFAKLLPDVFGADEERYRAFLDLGTLDERLATAPDGVLRDVFRVAGTGGDFRWTEHILAYAQGSERTQVVYGIRPVSAAYLKKALATMRGDERAGVTGEDEGAEGVLWDNLLPHLPLMLFWKDKERRFLGADKAFLDYFGLDSADDLIGRTDEGMRWHPITDRYKSAEQEVLDAGTTVRDLPGVCVRQGASTAVRATKWPIYRDGEVCGLMGYFREDASEDAASRGDAGASAEGAHGMRDADGFIRDLLAYWADYMATRQPFGIIRVAVPETGEVAAAYGDEAARQLSAACGDAILGAVGNRGVVARIGEGTHWVLGKYESREEMRNIGAQIRDAVASIRRVGDFDVTPSANVTIACEEELMALRKMALDTLFGTGSGLGDEWGRMTVERREALRDLVDSVPFGCCILDPRRVILYCNHVAEGVLGFAAEEMVGRRLEDMSMACTRAIDGNVVTGCSPSQFALATGRPNAMQMTVTGRGGREVVVTDTVVPIRDGAGKIWSMVAFIVPSGGKGAGRDAVWDLFQMAERDPVTRLPGRAHMEECLDEALELYRRTGHRFAVFFADVDNFHDVNNAYGHHMGDEILRSFGRTLLSQGRRTDEFCRWGGDEFVGILQLKRESDVTGAARRLMRATKEISISEGGRTVTCHVSIGMTVIREGDDLETVVDRADRYMYEAKRRKGDGIVTDFTAGGTGA